MANEITVTKEKFKQRWPLIVRGIANDFTNVLVRTAPVDTGYLKNSISVRQTGEGFQISMPYYALYCEFGCFFDENTKIITQEGIKRIKELTFKDLIFTGEEYKELSQKERIEINYPINKVKIQTETKYLEVTEDHPIMTKRGLIKAGELLETDEVLIYEKSME